jgi:hypothetical protein
MMPTKHQPQVGEPFWYKSGYSDEPFACIVTKRNAHSINVLVLDNGHGILTDDVGLQGQREVTLYVHDGESDAELWHNLPIGACMPPGYLP